MKSNSYITKKELDKYYKNKQKLPNKILIKKAKTILDKYIHWIGINNK